MQKTFRNDDDAYEFYKYFGRYHGFGVRKGDSRRDDDGNVRKRRISTIKTMRYMAGLAGEYSLVRFLKKDAYNYIDKQRHKQIVDRDDESAIAYLEGKAEADPMLMARYNLTKDRMLANMFWADGTTIFGFGPVLDETIGSYTWLLKSLSVVVTDGDEVMREAVRVVLPRATHRLYGWHFEKNVMSNVKDAGLRTDDDKLGVNSCAASVYTHAIFRDVRNEIVGVALVNLVGLQRSLTTKIYTIDEYGQPGREIVVLYDKNMGRMKCGCNFWNKHGYPCKHMFFVMKHEHLPNIPDGLVLKRWTKKAKALEAHKEKIDVDADQACLLHHGALHLACHWLFFLGSQKYDLFRKEMKGIHNLCVHLEGYVETEDNVFSTKGDGVIRNLVVVRTKGAPKTRNCRGRRRQCTECRNSGHTKRRCPGKKLLKGWKWKMDAQLLCFDNRCYDFRSSQFGDDAVVGANYNDQVAQCTNEDKSCHVGVHNMDMLDVGENNYVPTQTSAVDAQCNDNDEALIRMVLKLNRIL
ncbi:hypothetical protein Ahy_A02g007033 [Arachis hypogaea]|uniref:SWIM-type domain-containing protein n=1 Tax=Arachis hypogaea TaxID=3818 RepID=A0A445EBM5_ARAHY|nr:hypothetical protein Ahy_A02g007033 [Arachis hypogaea]